MKTFFYLLIFLAIACSCASNEGYIAYESENLKITQVSEHTWLHISDLITETYGNVSCNGLIYVSDGEAIVFDTPSNQQATDELIALMNEKGINIKYVVPTHFHGDCLGHLESFHENNIPSVANEMTIRLAAASDKTIPQNSFKGIHQLAVGSGTITLKHFGAGHTEDNIIAYMPDDQVLFGGCLVKSLYASEGNLEDADTIQWSGTIQKIKDEYPDLKFVVPGHGKFGSQDLLDYTITMFEQKQ
ncbi:MAG: subclass B1 metallo-beta-lactamase [Marinoscillum sp.]